MPAVAKRTAQTAMVVSVIALVFSLFGNVVVYISRSKVIEKNCERIEEVKSFARASGERALKSLRTLDYYKTHPKELEAQEALVMQQILDFTPSNCDESLLPWG